MYRVYVRSYVLYNAVTQCIRAHKTMNTNNGVLRGHVIVRKYLSYATLPTGSKHNTKTITDIYHIVRGVNSVSISYVIA
jgi:hypothetical protein